MKWTKKIRITGLVEHVCKHGIGHPDHGSALKVAIKYNHTLTTWLEHKCDGCCKRDDFPGK